MRRRIRLKKHFKKSKFKIFIVIIIMLFIFLYFIFKAINLKVNPVLLEYGELESRKLASIVINNAVAKNITENKDIENLFLITKDSKGDIKTIDFNPIIVNKVLTKITNSVYENFKYLEQGKIELTDIDNKDLTNYNMDKLKKGIIYEISSGVVFGQSFLANLGPKIPVKIGLMGNIVSHINTSVKDYGINNALIEVSIVLEVSQQVILPFIANKIKIETSIPVALKLIQGNIPNYYLNGINKNSNSFNLPIE
ncbi:MAG: sporulation protein YunB [Bacilli bacterium]